MKGQELDRVTVKEWRAVSGQSRQTNSHKKMTDPSEHTEVGRRRKAGAGGARTYFAAQRKNLV
jgi:hypothetical protein